MEQISEDIISKFFKSSINFRDIEYIDSSHSYTINGIRAISGTQLIHKYTNEFDARAIAEKVALKKDLPIDEILNDWAKTNASSTVKGTFLHEFIELSFQKRILELDDKELKEMIKKSLLNIQTFNSELNLKQDLIDVFKMTKESIELNKEKILNFLSTSKSRLIPIVSEFIIGDQEFRICGTIDQIFYNKTYNCLQIWDWKTNKAIEQTGFNNKKMLDPISHIDDSNFWHYSLQLSLYKFILKKVAGIDVGDLWLCHFCDVKEEYELLKCPYLEHEVQLILEDNLKQMLAEEAQEND